MRVTENSMIQNAIRNMADAESRLAQLQQINATQKAFQQPSDNPGVVSQVISLKSSLQASQMYQSTAQSTQGWMDATDQAFQGLSDLATQAIKAVETGLTDTTDDDIRMNTLAPQIDSFLHNAVDDANTTYQGKYIFSGFQVTKPTFIFNTTNQVVYNTVSMTAQPEYQVRALGPGQTIQVNVTGMAIKPLLDALQSARDALDPASGVFNRSALQTSLDGLNAAMDTLTQYQTQNGVRSRQVSNFLDQMDQTQLSLKSLISQKEDASLSESIMMLQQQQTVYQASLEVSQRAVSTLNLFDMMQ